MSATNRGNRDRHAPEPRKTLVLFDIDGTLTESFAVDGAAFLEALREAFGFEDVSDDWAAYRHVTDAGILAEVFQVRRGRGPSAEEVARVQGRFLALLAERVAAAGGLRPVQGAADLLTRLLASPDHAVAYASGSWRAAAIFKLRSAGLPTEGVLGAFSDDEISREGLCRLARHRAEALHGQGFSRVVGVGDGPWDLRSARALGYGFIGLGRGAEAEKLRAAGADQILPDFQDPEQFLTWTSNTPRLGQAGFGRR